MNENFEKYIEGLSPELQEKARECKTKEELNEFIADNDLEIPEDALEAVSGGCGTSTPPTPDKCNKCGAKVSNCTDSDLGDILAYEAAKNAPTEDDELMNIRRHREPMMGYISLSDYRRCPNCGIISKNDIHA